MACNETGYGRYAEGNNLFGIKGTGPAGSFSTQTWEDYGDGRVAITDNFRGYHSVAESFVDFAKLVTTSQRYQGAMGQTTVEGFVDGLRRGGYMTDPDYVQKIRAITTHCAATIKESLRAGGAPVATMTRTTAAPASRPQAGGPSAGVKVPDQFNVGLAPDEAYAACGPVAAVAFAQAYGRNPTPAEALELAKQSGWTAGGGMNGIANEKRLLDKMQLPSRLGRPPPRGARGGGCRGGGGGEGPRPSWSRGGARGGGRFSPPPRGRATALPPRRSRLKASVPCCRRC